MNILDEIAEKTRERIAQEKIQVPLEVLKEQIRERSHFAAVRNQNAKGALLGNAKWTFPEAAKGALPEVAKWTFPEAAKGAFPEPAKWTFPEAAKEAFPEAVKEAFPEAAKETFPEAAKEAFPEDVKKAFPEDAKKAFPENVKGALPGDTENLGPGNRRDFLRALQKPGMSYICEVKKASPSKGLIAADFPYAAIAREYEAAGASAISCLTEPYYFQGSDQYLRDIVETVGIPVLRKDFTIDEYMIYQAAAMGASAVLLICAILDDAQLAAYRQLAEDLGMEALTEAHDEAEVERALAAGARIIGVNNRDLKTFQVDMENSIRLRKLVPANVAFVSESGIRTAEDIRRLAANRTDAVLIGETLMRSSDKKTALENLNGGPLGQAN